VVNVSTLDELLAAGKIKDGKISPATLYAAGAVAKQSVPVKILGDGELKAKLEVEAHAFSKSAIKKIESAGGKALTMSSAK
jgi:large subunit ribosomal protein L15